MATETPTSHQTSVPDEPTESKVNEEVKPAEAQTISQVKGSEEEGKPQVMEQLPSQSIPNEETHSDKPAIPVPVPVGINIDTTAEPAVGKQEEQPVEAAVEKVQEEKPKVLDALEPSDEANVKPPEPLSVSPVQESAVPGVEEKQQEQSEVTDKSEKTGSSEVIQKVDQSETEVSKLEVKQKEETKVEKPVEQSFEATEKVQDPVVVLATDEPKAVAAQGTDDSVALSKEVKTPEPVVKVKLEEQSEVPKQVEVKPEAEPVIVKQVEEPESAIPVVQVKPEGQADIAEQVVIKSTDENPEPVEVKPEEKASESVNLEQAVSTEKDAQGDTKEAQGNIADKAGAEEVPQPTKAEEGKESTSNAEIAKTDGAEPVAENKKEENVKEETQASVETSKDRDLEVKLDKATTEESAKTNEPGVEKEKTEDSKAQSDLQNNKDDDDSKATQDLSREVPEKTTQKQSINIFSKVKQSLAKAKKAITGRSPSSKTVSSDTKDDIKVK